ncbi:MAG: DNA translocase FtsK 4TM domain-containing protein [Acetivibrionales bacterium]|jgi:S-DNA-T family DNA segregation ATPase FtsK/SpoIIIE
MKAQKKKIKAKKGNTRGKNRKPGNYNHEIIGIVVFSFGILILLSLYFNNLIGPFGFFVKSSLLGITGVSAYLLPPVIIIYGLFMIIKKDTAAFKLRILYSLILIALISSFIQTGHYRAEDYEGLNAASSLEKFFYEGKKLTGGGVVGGLISMPFLLLFKPLGTIIILATVSTIDIILLTNISIAGFIRNIKNLLIASAKSAKKVTEKVYSQDNEDIEDFEDDLFRFDSEAEIKPRPIEIKPRPKVINFEIEKKTRNIKDNEDIYEEFRENRIDRPDPVELVVNDLKEGKRKKRTSSIDEIQEDIPIPKRIPHKYKFPPLSLLNYYAGSGQSMKSFRSAAIEKAKKLEETLGSFGVEARVINISRGPTVTRYELQPSTGVKVSRIVNLADDISLNLAASGVRIEAPIPGKAAIGIEVPNDEVAVVSLREVIESSEFRNHPSLLSFAMGKDISGQCAIADIAKMPHLLIAGATGSGKSVCINSLIVSLLYKASPDEVKLLMIDPKVVELGIYNGIPHLLIPVVTDPKKAAGALNWAVQEMINRYRLFADKGVRDYKGYNDIIKHDDEGNTLPQIIIIIDELADLMMVAPNDVEDSICRLAQMARAAGMHLVIATQRPSVNVITGVIKANIPSRISFAVSSQVDSRTILDMGGAEKLLGKGDMLFYPVGTPKPIRVQGAYVSDDEIEKIVEFLKSQYDSEYDNGIIEEINNETNESADSTSDDCDDLLPSAIEMVVEAGQASVSLIQRKFKVGYARAARIIDQMEERGIVGGFEGSKPRQVLITRQQWQELQFKNEK